MKAKTASKIIENHLDGNPTETSKRIFTEIAGQIVASGLKPPFKVNKVAIFNPDEPEIEESPDFARHDFTGPDTNEFEQEEIGSGEEFDIPTDLGLKALLYHGGQFTDLYKLGSSSFADSPISKEIVEGAIRELESFDEASLKEIYKSNIRDYIDKTYENPEEIETAELDEEDWSKITNPKDEISEIIYELNEIISANKILDTDINF